VAPIGHKEKRNQRMLQVLILPPHATMRLIALAVHMTRTAHVAVAHDVEMTNSSLQQ